MIDFDARVRRLFARSGGPAVDEHDRWVKILISILTRDRKPLWEMTDGR